MSRAVLKDPNFRWYLGSVFTLTLAMGIQVVVVGWQVYALTGSKWHLGLIGLAEALPNIGVALFGGHFADRFNRKRIAILTTALLGLSSVGLLLVTHAEDLSWQLPAIYGAIVLSGIGRGLLVPARSALGTELTPEGHLAASVNLRTSVWQMGAVLGPCLGGILYAFGGALLAYSIDVALVVASLTCLITVRYAPRRVDLEAKEPFFVSVKGGIAFLRREPIILSALSLDLFAVLFGGATALLPVFAKEILNVGESGFGVLRAAPAMGAVVMSLLLMRLPPMKRAGRTLLISVAAFGLLTIAFGVSTNFYCSLSLLITLGAVDYISVCVRHTLIQTRTPTELLGRVAAVNNIFIGSSNEIGAFESGVTAEWFGTEKAVVLGGALSLLVVGVIATVCPSLRRLRDLSPQAREKPEPAAARALSGSSSAPTPDSSA